MAGSFDIGAVTATVKADISNFKDGMQKAKGEVSNLKSGMGEFASTVGKVGLVLGGFAIGAGLLVKNLADTAGEAQKEMIKANTLLENSFKDNTKELTQYQEAMKKTSQAMIRLGFDDEATSVAFAKSIVVTKDLAETQKEMGLAGDFARLKGIGIAEAQTALQMAYMGSARILKQYGIELEDGATKTEIFAKIQAVAGGQAEAFANSYAGASAKFGVEFDNLKEKLGEVFLPVLTQVVTSLADFVTKLNATDFTWFTMAIQTVIPIVQSLLTTVSTVVAGIIDWFNANLMPFILLLVAFWQENHVVIMTTVTETWAVIQAVVEAGIAIFTAIFGAFFALMKAWWKEHGDSTIAQLKAMWQIIQGLFQVAGAIIMALVSVITAFVTGDWDKAHNQLVKATMMAWNGIKNIFSGIIGFIANWGGQLVSNLVRPFQDAWRQIENLVNKIKDALDFTKRHSPSVVDIVQKGVGLVNSALGDLAINATMSPTMVAQTVSNGGQSTSIASININMDGAIIGSEYDANRIAERIGDGIIQKLKYSIRV